MCTMDTKHNEVQFFGSFAGYNIPFSPVENITEQDALERVSYYKAYYQENKLVCFEKYLHGSLFWKDNYIYWDNGKLKKRKMFKSDASSIIENYDEKGHLLKE